jgi:hypothetical protein
LSDGGNCLRPIVIVAEEMKTMLAQKQLRRECGVLVFHKVRTGFHSVQIVQRGGRGMHATHTGIKINISKNLSRGSFFKLEIFLAPLFLLFL